MGTKTTHTFDNGYFKDTYITIESTDHSQYFKYAVGREVDRHDFAIHEKFFIEEYEKALNEHKALVKYRARFVAADGTAIKETASTEGDYTTFVTNSTDGYAQSYTVPNTVLHAWVEYLDAWGDDDEEFDYDDDEEFVCGIADCPVCAPTPAPEPEAVKRDLVEFEGFLIGPNSRYQYAAWEPEDRERAETTGHQPAAGFVTGDTEYAWNYVDRLAREGRVEYLPAHVALARYLDTLA